MSNYYKGELQALSADNCIVCSSEVKQFYVIIYGFIYLSWLLYWITSLILKGKILKQKWGKRGTDHKAYSEKEWRKEILIYT